MKRGLKLVLLFSGVCFLNAAFAYRLTYNSSGDVAYVICNNGSNVGSIYWNGSKWSDGLRSSPDVNDVAKQIVAAQGTSCQ